MSFRSYKKEIKRTKERLEKERKEKNTLLQLENLSTRFAAQKTEYLEDAKKALKEGDQALYERTVSLIKNIIFQKAQIDDMLFNYKTARDIRDMGLVRDEFSKMMINVMTEVETLSEGIRFKDMEKSYTKGVYANSKAAQNLQRVLSLNDSVFSNYADKVSEISDKDIKQIIEGEIGKDTADLDGKLSRLEAEIMKGEKRDPVAAIAQPKTTSPIKTPVAQTVSSTPKAEAPKEVAPAKREAKPTESKPRSPEDKVLEEGGAASGEFIFNWDSLPSITFDDIAGLETVKQEVRSKVLLPLTNPELFEGYCQDNGGGLLLYGPPGTGKTMIAAAIANEVGAKFCSIKPSDLLHQGAGNTEKAVRALFAEARSFPCAVIFFDEMDSISPKDTRSQYSKQLRSELLAQLQGIEAYGKKNDRILFLIAATNKPWDIDSAFLRPGRFGTRIYVGLPDDEARKYIIQRQIDKLIHAGKVAIDENLDIDGVVTRTEGFNGSDITELMKEVKNNSIERTKMTGNKVLMQEDFDKALERRKSSVQKADIEKLKAWEKEV